MPGDELRDAAVAWTGEEVLVWGSPSGSPGFRYRPDTGVFTPISTVGAPAPRSSPYVAWTGRELIVWGGLVRAQAQTLVAADGGRYDPRTDRWMSISPDHGLGPLGGAVAV